MSLPGKFNIIIPPQTTDDNPGCLSRLADGDLDAFSWLYKNYCGKVYDYAYLITQDEELSSDMVQETFLKLWVKKKRLADVEKFSQYLFAIVRNLISDHFNEQQRRKKYAVIYQQQLQSADNKEGDRYDEGTDILQDAIQLLPGRQKKVFDLRMNKKMKFRDIAAMMNVSPYTAKAHRNKGFTFLKKYVREEMQRRSDN